MSFSSILDTKIIKEEAEADGMHLMLEKTRCALELVAGERANLWKAKAIHAFTNFDIYVALAYKACHFVGIHDSFLGE